jgi:glycosyltransferase involved in cell wall biosynthesis
MVQKENINILHGSMINDGGNKAYKLKKKYGLPMVISSHGFDVQTVPEIGYGACLEMETKKRIQNIIKNADHIIALCKMNMDHIIRLGGDEKKITIIPNGAHIHAINRIPFINQRGKFGIKPNDFLLLTIGRNKPIKRMNLLFKALALLKKTQIKCVCVGPIENLKKLVKKYNVEEMVILTGTIPKLDIKKSPPYTDLINLYRCSDLYLSTSFVECFSNAALDALSCGTPIVVGKNHGIRDIIIEGETGFVMKKETPHELADLIMVLKEKKNLRNDNNAISKSVEHMTWENTALQIFNIYKKVLNI